MDTWNRLTAVREERRERKRDWMKEGEGIGQEQICMNAQPMETDNNVVKARGKGAAWAEGGMGGKWGHL